MTLDEFRRAAVPLVGTVDQKHANLSVATALPSGGFGWSHDSVMGVVLPGGRRAQIHLQVTATVVGSVPPPPPPAPPAPAPVPAPVSPPAPAPVSAPAPAPVPAPPTGSGS